MILNFEEFITEQNVLNFIDIDIINESRKEAKLVAEIAKKQCRKWRKDAQNAMQEYKNAIQNKELMVSDFKKYSEECTKKMRKFNEAFDGKKENKYLDFSLIIYLIASIKESQTMLFKYGIRAIKENIKNTKLMRTYSEDKDFYSFLYKNQNILEKYIKKLVEDTYNNIEQTCKGINDRIDDFEKNSDISSIVFGDAKIKNKERHRRSKEFITVYHSDIEYFVKEYKLIGIEYDKRIKLVDKQEIFNRFYKKIMKTIEEEYKK